MSCFPEYPQHQALGRVGAPSASPLDAGSRGKHKCKIHGCRERESRRGPCSVPRVGALARERGVLTAGACVQDLVWVLHQTVCVLMFLELHVPFLPFQRLFGLETALGFIQKYKNIFLKKNPTHFLYESAGAAPKQMIFLAWQVYFLSFLLSFSWKYS